MAIDRSEFAIGIGPLVPDTHSMLLQIAYVGIAAQEPEQFVDDALQMEFFGGQQGETIIHTEAHLVTENGECARAGAVIFAHAFAEHTAAEVEILLHAGWGV